METASRTIARMWDDIKGYECFVRKRGDDWVLTLERAGEIIREATVESPGEAIRLSEEYKKGVRPDP
jgi:hypothetical protein